MTKIIWALCAVLGGFWIIGVVFKLFEDVIHFLLVIAGILGIFNIVRLVNRGPATE
jgi:hypothetical protein